MSIIKIVLGFMIAYVLYAYMLSPLVEGWATSPGTLIQLASSSAYYPYWQYSYGYRYPEYRMMYPYYERYPTYEQHAYWPKPYGYYNMW